MHFASPYYLWLLSALVPMIAYYVWRTLQGGASIQISSVEGVVRAPKTVRYWLRHLPFALRLAALAINLVLRLPVLSGVNTLGGALLGLLEGMMVVWLLIWLAPRLGIALPAENTYLLHFFMTVGPMGLLSSLS